MTEQDLTLLDAIRVGMRTEQEAVAVYTDAAQKAGSHIGRGLFEQLAEFERGHYRKLAALEQSLRDQGAFVDYEGQDLGALVPAEARSFKEPNRTSLMGIITAALEFERQAEKRYTVLAKQVTDPAGRAMFERLAEEERGHYRVLRDAYWNLNNHGVWAQPADTAE
jgi:rubrerythrin